MAKRKDLQSTVPTLSEKELPDFSGMTPLQKAQAIMRIKRENGEEIERLSPIEKAHKNPKSLRLAINGKCYDCCAESKTEIRDCHITDCTLHPVRPYQKK